MFKEKIHVKQVVFLSKRYGHRNDMYSNRNEN